MSSLAVALALASAACFAACSVLQHAGARSAPRHRALRVGLFRDLLRQPLWVAGTALDVIAAALQAAALHFGALAVVQPLLVLGLLFVVPLAALVAHRRPRAVELGGAAACVIGLAVFLAAARPGGGTSSVALGTVGLLVACSAVGIAACLAAARRFTAGRATWLATGAAIAYAVSATALKLVTDEITGGLVPLLTHWPVYVLAASAAVGMLLNQNAFQAGSLPTPMAAMTVVEPVVAVLIAVSVLDEHVTTSVGGLALTVTGFVAMAVGVALVARGRAERDLEELLATRPRARVASAIR